MGHNRSWKESARDLQILPGIWDLGAFVVLEMEISLLFAQVLCGYHLPLLPARSHLPDVLSNVSSPAIPSELS